MTTSAKFALMSAALLLSTGCKAGGGGLFSGFGGGDAGGVFALFGGGGGGSGDDTGGSAVGQSGSFGALSSSNLGVGGGVGGTALESFATVHNPEPGSMALFGGGLAGMAWWRRRKARRSLQKPA